MKETMYQIPGMPTLAVLADFHNGNPDPILRSLHKHRPHFILIPGDFVYGTVPLESYRTRPQLKMHESENALHLFHGCSSIAPTFVSLGNHEWMLHPLDIQAIEKTGVTVLDNAFTNRDGILIGGLSSARVTAYQRYRRNKTQLYPKEEHNNNRRVEQPDTAWLPIFAATPGIHILLSHHPEYYERIPSSIELIVAGHAHGGQWRFFDHGVFAPGQGWWPELTSGVHDGRMVISRGLTNTARIPRINNPTEIVYVNA